MSLSDRSNKKSNDLSKISFFSDRGNQIEEIKSKNSKIKLSNEEVDSIRSSKKSNSSTGK
jgi:hypothetical protein